MDWEDLEPIVKVVPRVQASTYVNNDGKPRIRLFFSDTMLGECGRPKAANVQFATKDGVAMVRLVWDPKGKFNVGDLGRGGARIQNIPAKAPAPDGARESEPCEVQKKDKTEAIIILPLEAWEKQLRQPAKTPAPAPAPLKVASAALAEKRDETKKLDAVYYLRSKGVKISKLAGDWWTLNGNRTPRIDVLARVNEFRRSASLPALGLEDIE